jgi:glycosyltransferase involved in cell wall biosynthesis
VSTRVIWACPSYGSMEPVVAIGQRLAIMHASKNTDVVWSGDCSPNDVKLSTIDTARNRIVKEAINTDADYVFWCDSDIVLPPDALTNLLLAKKDFITGIYCQRRHPYYPVITHFDPDGDKTPAGNMNWFVEWPENTVAPVDGCGFGVVLTSTKMLRKMSPNWFSFTHFSEDFTFCRNAANAGIQLYVHTGVLCQHMGDREAISVDTFKQSWKGGLLGPEASSAA